LLSLVFDYLNKKKLAGIKHLNRLEQVLAQTELTSDFQEAILCNDEGDVISSISANIYFVINSCLYIPKLDNSGVEGTIRAQIINYCQKNGIPYKIDNFSLSFLNHASEVFISNAIRGLWPVKFIKLLSKVEINLKPGFIYHQLDLVINHELHIHSTNNHGIDNHST